MNAKSESTVESHGKAHLGDTTLWYVGTIDGKQRGPISFVELQESCVSGAVSPTDLVWRDGMQGWTRACEISELAGSLSAREAHYPMPPLLEMRLNTDSASGLSLALGQFFGVLSEPMFFRTFGRISALVGILILLPSMLLWFWGFSWFEGVLACVTLFFLGEAVGTVVELLSRNESK